ncbi:MAG TPA: hypothetical protein VFI78_00315 [Salinimicrobium sp.]|nr:hypothetical protein [Salinimicrobium sp.]
MKKNRKIDDIFREKVVPVETNPPKEVWENISLRLAKKQKRVFPLWLKIGGAAAALALLFGILNNSYFSNPKMVLSPVNPELEKPSFRFDITSLAFEEIMMETEKIFKVEPRLHDDITKTRIQKRKSSEKNSFNQNSTNKPPSKEVNKNPQSASSITEVSGGKTDGNFGDENPEKNRKKLKVNTVNSIVHTEEKTPQDLKKEISEEENNSKDDFFQRLSLTPTVAAIYFDHSENGNLIDENLNSKGNGQISFSYGIKVDYKISEKLKLRSGISKVNLDYQMKNLDYFTALSTDFVNPPLSATTPPQGSRVESSLQKNFSFIEIPLEVEYSLIDHKFGVNLIGGVSALFLDENKISLQTENYTPLSGEAKNLNQTSFSLNFGFGLQYNLNSSFLLNFEPMFKYQINTFTNLNSYYFGFYTGLSYKF